MVINFSFYAIFYLENNDLISCTKYFFDIL